MKESRANPSNRVTIDKPLYHNILYDNRMESLFTDFSHGSSPTCHVFASFLPVTFFGLSLF